MKHRVVTLLLAAAVCLGVIAAFIPSALAFSDVTGADVAEAVEVLSGLGIVDGYSDGGYHPNDTLTRAQFCKLAVLVEGHADQVKGSAYRTLFSDVPASHWAASYVNLAYEEGLVSGYGNGTFGPDDPVTTAQAATIVLHLLGYSNDHIGPFWPEDYLEKAQGLGLLDGIDRTSSHSMTRGEAALLLCQMLNLTTADGKDYAQVLAASTVGDAVLMDNDAQDDGSTLIYANGTLTYYDQAKQLSEALVGRRGTLLLNQSGKVSGFIPDESRYKEILNGEADSSGVTDSSGTKYTVPSSAVLVMDDEVSTYGMKWYDLENRAKLLLYYGSSGSVELVVASESTTYDGVMLTGYYESASPNTGSPSTIVLLGIELEVDDTALSSLSGLSVGSRITVTLNGDGEVVSAFSASSVKVEQYGVVTSVGSSSAQVKLSCGLTASGELYSSSSAQVGELVRVTAAQKGKLTLSSVSASAPGKLDLAARTLGSIQLSDQIAVYERAGNSTVVQIDLDDILVDTVSNSKIDFYATDSQGKVHVLLLNDVTGSAYTYGILDAGEQSGGSGQLTYTNRTVTVENSQGTGQTYITGATFKDGAVGGVAVSGEGKAVKVITLTESREISRSAFDGSDAVVVDGVRVPISDEVEVYNSDTGLWTTLEAAKSYSDTFAVYYSGSLGSDAVVRVIETE